MESYPYSPAIAEANARSRHGEAMIESPQRFFLDNVPKQAVGTCFVLNTDYQKLEKHLRSLEEGLAAAVRWVDRGIARDIEAKHIRRVDEGFTPEYVMDLAAIRYALAGEEYGN